MDKFTTTFLRAPVSFRIVAHYAPGQGGKGNKPLFYDVWRQELGGDKRIAQARVGYKRLQKGKEPFATKEEAEATIPELELLTIAAHRKHPYGSKAVQVIHSPDLTNPWHEGSVLGIATERPDPETGYVNFVTLCPPTLPSGKYAWGRTQRGPETRGSVLDLYVVGYERPVPAKVLDGLELRTDLTKQKDWKEAVQE